MNTVSIGTKAEDAAAAHMRRCGYRIVERNWRTRRCEIDIIAEKGGELLFVEVKYRRHGAQGYGLDYLTPRKLQQMRFAAESWVAAHNWTGNYYLAAAEVQGEDFSVTAFLKELS